eukprot:TRINITY_DN14284_c0_g1_i3.p2 TRINITY_DN14284_c0_g1~~TRINITY_DN14284_c0_g1_i3.p2  ORF type:complete len:144 (+),score=26.38 TRINITY_DN14284_c0_g1_i3:152-583(+)
MGQRTSSSFLHLTAEIEAANKIAGKYPDSSRTVLHFSLVKDGSSHNGPLWYLWCTIVGRKLGEEGNVVKEKILSVEQFQVIFRVLRDTNAKFLQRSGISSDQRFSILGEDGNGRECMICMDNKANVCLPSCNHEFCEKCISQW